MRFSDGWISRLKLHAADEDGLLNEQSRQDSHLDLIDKIESYHFLLHN